MALLRALLWFLRGALALRSFALPLRPWCLLLVLGRALLWLLRLLLSGWPPLLRRHLDGGGPLNVGAARLWRLSAGSG